MEAKITAKEMEVLKAIVASDYQMRSNPVGEYVWSWSANPFDSPRSLGGVVASLSKKGLVTQSGDGEEACLAITQAGYDVLQASEPKVDQA